MNGEEVNVTIGTSVPVTVSGKLTYDNYEAFGAEVKSSDRSASHVSVKSFNEWDDWRLSTVAPEFDSNGNMTKNPEVIFKSVPTGMTYAILRVYIVLKDGTTVETTKRITSTGVPETIMGIWEELGLSEEGVGKYLDFKQGGSSFDVVDYNANGIISNQPGTIEYDSATDHGTLTLPSKKYAFCLLGTNVMFVWDPDNEEDLESQSILINTCDKIDAEAAWPSKILYPEYQNWAGPSSQDDLLPALSFSESSLTQEDGVGEAISELLSYTIASLAVEGTMTLITTPFTMLFNWLFPADPEPNLGDVLARLDDVNDKLEEISSSLKNLSTKITVQDDRNIIQQRINMYSTLYPNTKYNYMQVIRYDSLIVASKEDAAKVAEYKEKRDIVLKNWANQTYDGVKYQNIADKWYRTIAGVSNCIFNVYDEYIYNTTAFDSQGYDFREAYRYEDLVLMEEMSSMSLAYLKSLYQKTNDPVEKDGYKTQMDDIFKYRKLTAELAKANSVKRDNDHLICHVPGAKIVISPDAKSFGPFWEGLCVIDVDQYKMYQEPTAWPSNPTYYMKMSDEFFVDPRKYIKTTMENDFWRRARFDDEKNVTIGTLNQSTMMETEADAILKFFNYEKTFSEILALGGIHFPYSNNNQKELFLLSNINNNEKLKGKKLKYRAPSGQTLFIDSWVSGEETEGKHKIPYVFLKTFYDTDSYDMFVPIVELNNKMEPNHLGLDDIKYTYSPACAMLGPMSTMGTGFAEWLYLQDCQAKMYRMKVLQR